MFTNPIVNRCLSSVVPTTVTLDMIGLYKARVLLPLIEGNEGTSCVNLSNLLMFAVSSCRQVNSLMLLIIRTLRQERRSRILKSNLGYNVKDSRPIRRLFDNLLVLFKSLKIRTPMVTSRLVRTLILFTLNTGMSKRRSRVIIERKLALSLIMSPRTVLRRRNLTYNRFNN